MAVPNIVGVTSIIGTTEVAVLTTTLTTTIVTAASDKVVKMNLIRCTNITDNDATVTFDVEVSGTHKKIANEVTVPANSVVDIVDKNSSLSRDSFMLTLAETNRVKKDIVIGRARIRLILNLINLLATSLSHASDQNNLHPKF